jgi:hypothetical protein
MKETHKQLQDIAIRWLCGIGCNVFAKEVPSKTALPTHSGSKAARKTCTTLSARLSCLRDVNLGAGITLVASRA